MSDVPLRLIGLLTWHPGRLVKSYGYQKWRPAVSLAAAIRSLDRWNVDEIVVLDISRRGFLDQNLLRSLAQIDCRTPLAVGGGIRSCEDITQLLRVGCDRFVIESPLFTNTNVVREMADFVGKQALIGSLPITGSTTETDNIRFRIWSPRPEVLRENRPLDLGSSWLGEGLVAEIMVTAVDADGLPGTFPLALAEEFKDLPDECVIWSGGVDSNCAAKLLKYPQSAGVAVGVQFQHFELPVHQFREEVLSISGIPFFRKTVLS